MRIIRLGIIATLLGVSGSAMADNGILNIQKRMNNVLTNCNDTLQTVAGEFYVNNGYFPGTFEYNHPYTKEAEFEALETIINRCMNSKFVGGANYVEFSDADLADWESALSTDTVKISYPTITVEIDGQQQLVQGMQMDILLGGAKKRPNGKRTANLAPRITKSIPSTTGKLSFLLTENSYVYYGNALNYCGYQVDSIGFTGTTSLGNIKDKHLPRRCQASSDNPLVDKPYAIKNRMNDIVNSCGSYLKVGISEYYADRGYLPGLENDYSILNQSTEKELLQDVVNTCILSKYVGGEFVNLDIASYEADWIGTMASSQTVKISYPEEVVESEGYTVSEAMQFDISIGGSKYMPTGEETLNISKKITGNTFPNDTGKISFVFQVLGDEVYGAAGFKLLCGKQVADAGYPDKTTVSAELLPDNCK